MSDTHEETMFHSDSLEKLVIYVYLRMIMGWAKPYIKNRDWMEMIKDENIYFILEYWGDSEAPSYIITLKIQERTYIKGGFGMSKTRQINGGRIELRVWNNSFDIRDALFSSIYTQLLNDSAHKEEDSESSTFEQVFKRYGGFMSEKEYEPRMDSMQAEMEEIFCKVTDANFTLLEDVEAVVGAISCAISGNIGLNVAKNVDIWKAILAFFYVLHEYEVDCSC